MCSICPRSRPASSRFRSPTIRSRTSCTASAARSSRWQPRNGSRSRSRCRRTCRAGAATSVASPRYCSISSATPSSSPMQGEVVGQRVGGERVIQSLGTRHWAGHFRGRSGQAVPGIPAGRQFDHTQEGRDRTWAGDLQADHRAAWRADLGGVRARGKDRRSRSRFRSRSSNRRGRHEQAHSGGRGPRGQSADPARSARQRRLRIDRGRER